MFSFGGWLLWALCMVMENHLLDTPIAQMHASGVGLLGSTVIALSFVLLGYYFYKNSKKMDVKAEERETDILKKYGIKVESLKNEEIDRVLEQICNQRAPTDGFAEQNGRDAERADLTCSY